jgi:hypothetical protein
MPKPRFSMLSCFACLLAGHAITIADVHAQQTASNNLHYSMSIAGGLATALSTSAKHSLRHGQH